MITWAIPGMTRPTANGGNSRNGYRAKTVLTEAGRLTKCRAGSAAALPAATRCGPPALTGGRPVRRVLAPVPVTIASL